MQFSYHELSRLVDLSTSSPEAIRDRLTFAGFEVEGMWKMAEASKLIIGHILTCEKHPDSDHLHLLTVECGDEGIRNIVCGAPNARVGLNVIVALPGCELPAIGVTIKPGMVRGKQSDGMCCSLSELGVDKSVQSEAQLSGIEELPEDAPVGSHEVLSYLGLDDTIFDINVLPNRPDCLSYYGMAREIASLTGYALRKVPSFDQVKFDASEKVSTKTSSEKCARFDAITLHNITPVKETPLDIRRVLEAGGIRSVSPMVDLGNYVMLLSGEPLNLYDLSDIEGETLEVRDDFEGSFTCFDGKKVDLIKGDLVVANQGKPLCLAGIMAGQGAQVKDTTKDLFIEAACFFHASIRHTSNRLGLSSASSLLFAKGRNPKMIPEAIAILVSVLPRFFEEYTIGGYASDSNIEMKEISFPFSLEQLNKRLGTDYSEEEVNHVLDAYRIERKGDMLYPPMDRVDLLENCDIEEEVFRFYGSERVHASFKDFPITQGALTPAQKQKREIRELLVDRGFDEILTYTLISKEQDDSLRVFHHDEGYRITNPMTKDHEIIRSDLLPSMISCIRYNVAHQHENLRLFEVSSIDTPKGNHIYLSIGLRGVYTMTEDFGAKPYDFFYLKGIIEAIFARLGIPETRYRLAYSKNEKFHPTCSADIFFGKDLVGTFGQLHPSFSKDRLFLAELDLGYLLSLKGGATKFKPFESYPLVRRDLSVKLNDKVTFDQIKKTILRTKDTYVKDVLFFDLFEEKLLKNKYLGISLLLGKEGGTLKDSEIQDSLNKTVKELKGQLGLTLRGENV